MDETFVQLMKDGCGQLPLTLTERQTEQFYEYYELLTEWNRVMNLTAITELSEVVTKHFADSLLLLRAVPEIKTAKLSCIDVGTGAGFPGIPLKIAFPQLQVTLLDSLNKRVQFLNEVVGKLGLSGVETVHGRAEDFGRDKGYRERYDLCVSRAVANLSTLSEYCLPFVKIGGRFIPYKSGKISEELSEARGAVKKLGGGLEPVVSLLLPGTEVERTFVPVKKLAATSARYPRKAGLPSKEPLK